MQVAQCDPCNMLAKRCSHYTIHLMSGLSRKLRNKLCDSALRRTHSRALNHWITP
jgi:hypothetical protein